MEMEMVNDRCLTVVIVSTVECLAVSIWCHRTPPTRRVPYYLSTFNFFFDFVPWLSTNGECVCTRWWFMLSAIGSFQVKNYCLIAIMPLYSVLCRQYFRCNDKLNVLTVGFIQMRRTKFISIIPFSNSIDANDKRHHCYIAFAVVIYLFESHFHVHSLFHRSINHVQWHK